MNTRPDHRHSRHSETVEVSTPAAKTIRRLGALTVCGLLAAALAAPASAEPDHRSRDEWRHRHDRHDRHIRRGHDSGRHHDRHDRGFRRGHHSGNWQRHGHSDRGFRRGHDGGNRHQRFDRGFHAPTRIHSFREYERYSYGRVYYREHRHHHRVLAFPDPSRVSGYGLYSYCGDALFGRGAISYDGPRLSIRWRF